MLSQYVYASSPSQDRSFQAPCLGGYLDARGPESRQTMGAQVGSGRAKSTEHPIMVSFVHHVHLSEASLLSMFGVEGCGDELDELEALADGCSGILGAHRARVRTSILQAVAGTCPAATVSPCSA